MAIMLVLIGFAIGAAATLASSDRWTTFSIVTLICSFFFALCSTALLIWGEIGGDKGERGNASDSSTSRSTSGTD